MIRLALSALLLNLALLAPVLADDISDLMACFAESEFEPASFLECSEIHSKTCLDAGESVLDYGPQIACYEALTHSVEAVRDDIFTRSEANPESLRLRTQKEALRRAFSVADAECRFQFETRMDPTRVTDHDRHIRASCIAIGYAAAYWAIIVHDRVKP